jgi:hypothetical protein
MRTGVLSRVVGWIDSLPGRGWWFYPLVYGLLFAASHGILWATHQLPFGSIDPIVFIGLFYGPYTLAAIAYINRSSVRALEAFWPATGWPDEEREAWRDRLVTSPARWDLPLIVLGLAITVASFLGAAPGLLGTGDRAIRFLAYLIPAGFGYVAAPLAFAHSVHQLRLVARIHREARAIDPFDRVPLYAFSSMTSRTGLAYSLSGYYTLVFNGPFQAGNATAIVTLGALFVVAGACFFLPLWGIHERLVREKDALLRDVELRMGRLSEEMYRRIDAGQFETTKVVSDALAGVADLRKRVIDVPTWPWRPQVLSGFLSALLLPVAVYLITRGISGQLGL